MAFAIQSLNLTAKTLKINSLRKASIPNGLRNHAT